MKQSLSDIKGQKKAVNEEPNENTKPHSTEIDMSDNIFLSYKNPELVQRKKAELLQ